MPESAFFFAIAQILITSFYPISLIHFSLQKNIVFMPQLSAGFKITF